MAKVDVAPADPVRRPRIALRPTAVHRGILMIAGAAAATVVPDDWQRFTALFILALASYWTGRHDGRRDEALEFLLRRDR